MLTDPVNTDVSRTRTRDSFNQWVPQHSLSGEPHNLSRPMSLHLHSTSRRVFIGPTPANWNYKKTSLWFSKSEKAVHHGTRRRKTFRAESDVVGPNNMTSLYYNASDDQSEKPNMITDAPFLVEEPQDVEELEITESDVDCPTMSREVFYTPSENMKNYPVTPPHNPRVLNSKSHHSLTLPLHLHPTLSVVNSTLEEDDSQHDDASISSINLSNIPINYDEINDPNFDANNADVNSDAGYFDLPVYSAGTIIKEDCILIRIERVYHSGVPRMYNESTSRKYFTNSSGWREYNVKLKPDRIEFYKNKKKAVDQLIFSYSTRLSLYSPVDYTLALSTPNDDGMKVFIFRLKTYSLSVGWYRALYNLLTEPSVKPLPSVCDVVVPDLDVRVQIPLKDVRQAFKITAEEITKTVLDELSGINEWEDVLNEWLQNSDMRLCWKRYDRIEWIVWEKNDDDEKDRSDLLACPQFIEGTHQLQLRCTEHYPTSVTLPDETKLQEPPPVEGYLIRVTNEKGRKNRSKRLYFSSHDYYLFFLKPFIASPPPPPSSSLEAGSGSCSGSMEDDKTNHKRPLIYAVSPHAQGPQYVDAFLKANSKRRIKQIINAYGFINLIDVKEVRPLTDDNGEDACENDHAEDQSKELKSEGKGCPFELVMMNGMSIVLEAYSKTTMKEWVNCLDALIKYWKARVADDVKIQISTFKINQFNNYDDNSASIGDGIRGNWDNFRSYANPTIWHWCILNGCRGITKSGLLYQKFHYYGTFNNYYHVLTRGYLIFYRLYSWSTTGRKLHRCYHRRKGIINLLDCYVYSGQITDHDLSYSRNLNRVSTEMQNFPRIYSDGMCCFDDDDECTFVVWQGNKHVIKRSGAIGVEFRKKATLDAVGKVWIFRARNRSEREEWVCALNVEIERCLMEHKRTIH
ncbi:Pleckstrin homology domain-containing protein [Gigaspora rosea]|uniref:Pleckstrin homology domain-containing protein n=1 Tax=Gigaspora rosea TaxID=44941 RepID=A0A397V6Q3_9GLOM|nr:Pleckstrin homology domain-containing protein [Gigaspora rosea]